MRKVQSGREMFEGFGHYDILSFMPPGLLLDVGAAAGDSSMQMLQKTPNSKVLAYEPFPGNHPFLLKKFGNDSRIVFRPVACGSKIGIEKFAVAKTVDGTEAGWENKIGYSSGGYLATQLNETRPTIDVECVRLENEVSQSDEVPKYLKIDVQGGELSVLKGAEKLLNRGLPIIFCEYSGQEGLLDELFEKKYIIYDTGYLIVPRTSDDQLPEWNIYKSVQLSSGRKAYLGWPLFRPENLEEYEHFIKSQRPKRMVVQTDLFCIHESFLEEFKNIRLEFNKNARRVKPL